MKTCVFSKSYFLTHPPPRLNTQPCSSSKYSKRFSWPLLPQGSYTALLLPKVRKWEIFTDSPPPPRFVRKRTPPPTPVHFTILKYIVPNNILDRLVVLHSKCCMLHILDSEKFMHICLSRLTGKTTSETSNWPHVQISTSHLHSPRSVSYTRMLSIRIDLDQRKRSGRIANRSIQTWLHWRSDIKYSITLSAMCREVSRRRVLLDGSVKIKWT